MKSYTKLLFVSLFIVAACGKTSDHSGHDQGSGDENPDESNEALYDQVMNIHDEVMPKMEDIYKIKSEIQEKIATSEGMALEKKQELENVMLQLDSANDSMMDWMHNFNPLPDSIDQEQARAYLESEMEKIQKVKVRMLEAIEEAKETTAKN